MIVFPNAKINLGLHITEKRADGFHDIETVFYPVGWCDVLEVIENRQSVSPINIHLSGLTVAGPLEENLLYKAYKLMEKTHVLPHIDVHLHKVIPMGAGLGGGSADAAFFIELLNTQFGLGLTEEHRLSIARQLGSDCAFFIKNTPVYATEKGDVFEASTISLKGYHIAIVWPDVHSNTKEAYSLVVPQKGTPLKTILEAHPVHDWKTVLHNGFEPSIFSKYPDVKQVKEQLYEAGAVYAAMSGSGSAVFGLFEHAPELKDLRRFPHWTGLL